MREPMCTVVGCQNVHSAKGLCTTHYNRVWRTGTTDLKRLPISANPWACRVVCPDCGSSDWTLPYDPTVVDSSWRCVACHCWAAGPMRDKS